MDLLNIIARVESGGKHGDDALETRVSPDALVDSLTYNARHAALLDAARKDRSAWLADGWQSPPLLQTSEDTPTVEDTVDESMCNSVTDVANGVLAPLDAVGASGDVSFASSVGILSDLPALCRSGIMPSSPGQASTHVVVAKGVATTPTPALSSPFLFHSHRTDVSRDASLAHGLNEDDGGDGKEEDRARAAALSAARSIVSYLSHELDELDAFDEFEAEDSVGQESLQSANESSMLNDTSAMEQHTDMFIRMLASSEATSIVEQSA